MEGDRGPNIILAEVEGKIIKHAKQLKKLSQSWKRQILEQMHMKTGCKMALSSKAVKVLQF